MAEILLGVTGSIAAYKAAELASSLTKAGHAVHVILTRAATQFITPLTFQSLTGQAVYTDMFAEVQVHDVQHISLAKRADLVLLAPASANLIGKLVGGIADDMLTTVCMAAHRKRTLLCPAMNTAMWENPVVQGNVAKLQALGVELMQPREARLACGDVGRGALAETADILARVEEMLHDAP
ncbi:MAG: phosphopantothenoylcysteine decarboxylase [Oscillospiraceae bacterium]|jgi:phosphopantothenoylcysteine decarboxylase/phosphopantothenoylcysteine decarboxylase/phosphopantothenate--cysteine ligase|nr:phosphopantothenoylcysteine decarboxylase [Oscillospiraceae bacterium]